MATFISPLILFGFFAVLVGFIGKFIYDFQQNKKQTQTEDGFEFKDDFQKLAGIKPTNPNDEIRQILVKNNIFAKEQIIEALLKAAKNGEFPKQDESINIGTTKIGTINTNFGSDNDPLATIPMSRVSKEGKKKMAQIAKEDIKITTEKYSKELISKGLVTMPEETKSKRKYKKKPKA
jgi:hypothetical protein